MEKINADTHVEQILMKYPALSRIFIDFGLPCLVCGEPFWGTIAELGSNHSISIDKLNEVKAEIDEKS
ncbi:MAG: DUF1858 domain-containing protein [candidate division WOR-3 bacterium]|nr:DUF1858 domain-containing protein [candidate division WOR-3 bacterium]